MMCSVAVSALALSLFLGAVLRPVQAAPPPLPGTWQLVGTSPPGFVRHGAEVGRITITIQKGALHGVVLTGKHRYTATGRYIAAHHELQLVISTVKGKVRLQATIGPDQRRMIGTWYDTHGNDGGIVLMRL
jgi:hypothetical protein